MSNVFQTMDEEIELLKMQHSKEIAKLKREHFDFRLKNNPKLARLEYLEAELRRRPTPEDTEPTLHDVFDDFPIRVCNVSPQEDDK